MAPRGPRPAVLLTLALLAASLALSSGQSWVRLKKKFIKEHVDFPRTPADSSSDYCEEMMNNRGIYGKQKNTFIHASMQKISQVCSWGGIRISPNLRKSVSLFKVTTCFLKRRSGTYGGRRSTQKIVIACWKRLPVLYVGWDRWRK